MNPAPSILRRTRREPSTHQIHPRQPPGPRDERLCRARFLKLRELPASNKELVRRLHELEAHIEDKLTAHDRAIAAVLSEIRQLTNPPTPKQRPIGFTANLREDK